MQIFWKLEREKICIFFSSDLWCWRLWCNFGIILISTCGIHFVISIFTLVMNKKKKRRESDRFFLVNTFFLSINHLSCSIPEYLIFEYFNMILIGWLTIFINFSCSLRWMINYLRYFEISEQNLFTINISLP